MLVGPPGDATIFYVGQTISAIATRFHSGFRTKARYKYQWSVRRGSYRLFVLAPTVSRRRFLRPWKPARYRSAYRSEGLADVPNRDSLPTHGRSPVIARQVDCAWWPMRRTAASSRLNTGRKAASPDCSRACRISSPASKPSAPRCPHWSRRETRSWSASADSTKPRKGDARSGRAGGASRNSPGKARTAGRPLPPLGRNQGAIGIPRAPGTGHRPSARTGTCVVGGTPGAGARTDRPDGSHAAFPGLASAGRALYPEALRRGRVSPS